MSEVAEAWRSLPRVMRIILASLAAFLGSIATISASLSTIEPWLPAHRQFPRDLVMDQDQKTAKALQEHVAETKRIIAPTKIGMYDIQLGIARARRAAINDQIFAAEISAPKSNSQDELIRHRQRLQKLKDDLVETEEEIKLIRDARERN